MVDTGPAADGAHYLTEAASRWIGFSSVTANMASRSRPFSYSSSLDRFTWSVLSLTYSLRQPIAWTALPSGPQTTALPTGRRHGMPLDVLGNLAETIFQTSWRQCSRPCRPEAVRGAQSDHRSGGADPSLHNRRRSLHRRLQVRSKRTSGGDHQSAVQMPSVRRKQNDSHVAEATCTAARQLHIPRVPEKTVERQTVQALHRARQRMVNHRTALVSQTRNILLDRSPAMPKSITRARRLNNYRVWSCAGRTVRRLSRASHGAGSKCQLNVCSLSFKLPSSCLSNTWVAIPPISEPSPPFALHREAATISSPSSMTLMTSSWWSVTPF